MAGQGLERREIIRIMALASVASTFPGFQRWAFACEHASATRAVSTQATGKYQPQFFTEDEFQLVDRLAELIIPADDSPGAHDAGVSEFIDFMVANEADLSDSGEGNIQVVFRSGLKWMNARSVSLFGASFLECGEAQQTEMLGRLAYKDRFKPGEEVGQSFFAVIRDFTAYGYYTSRIGLEAVGYPGLHTWWLKMPGCPHKDDPEHLHLPPPVI